MPEGLTERIENAMGEDQGQDVFASKPEIERAECEASCTGDQRSAAPLENGSHD